MDIDGEEEGGEIKAVNDHCILLIDARPNMFESLNDEGDVRMLAAQLKPLVGDEGMRVHTYL